jgi:hypothetical protein
MNPYFEALLPILSLVITTLFGLGVAYLKKRYDIQVEVADRDALHSALTTGVQAAVARINAPKVQPPTPHVPPKSQTIAQPAPVYMPMDHDEVIQDAISYASRSVPEALLRLNPPAGILAEIALSKLSQVLNARR